MFNRNIRETFLKVAAQYPVTTITGPRQSGKTTLIRNLFANKPYFNLEDPEQRALILADPKRFFKNNPDGAMLDEIQNAPELMSYIQVIVDEQQKNNQFILTGSHQLQLHKAISQSLAGRTAMLELLPLTIDELEQSGTLYDLDSLMVKGFFPGIYQKNLDHNLFYSNYTLTYVERDVRQLLNIKDLNDFQRFFKLLASRVSIELKKESIANDVGVTNNTIKSWLSIMEASYLVKRLYPYHENFGKRIIKSPKVYFTDTGLVSYLLQIETSKEMNRDRIRGGVFENLVVMEIVKYCKNIAKDANIYFFKDSHGNEVDILIKHRGYLIPIEVKSTSTFSNYLLKNLIYFKKLADSRVPFGFLIYTGEHDQKIGDIYVISYKKIAKIFKQIEEL